MITLRNLSAAVGVRSRRIEAFDTMRGIALVLMALDHAAYFTKVGVSAEHHQGVQIDLSLSLHLLTGLLTNIAAPTFWFLAGVSLALFVQASRQKQWSEVEITRFLLVRAVIILLLDGVVGLIWGFSFNVLSSLAMAIAILSVLRSLPNRVIACLGIIVTIGYEWLWRQSGHWGLTSHDLWFAIWVTPNDGMPSPVPFPVLGWIGLTMLGYAVTAALREGGRLQSPHWWFKMGVMLLILAVVLRMAGHYGNIVPYESDQPWHYFLVMSKDPVSLTYLLFNLAWMCFILTGLLSFQDPGQQQPLRRVVTLFGQTPLFFYVMHILVYRILGGGTAGLGLLKGYGILRAYLVWTAGLSILAPLCLTYRYAKLRYPNSPLRYI